MKIKGITITDFKGIKGTRKYNLENKINAFWGNNGIGKTSTIDAIKFALTGAYPKNPIHMGRNTATVQISIDNEVISRTIVSNNGTNFSTSATLNGKNISITKLNDYLKEKTGIDVKNIRTLTSSELISALSKELGSFFMSYIPDEVTREDVIEWIVENNLGNNKINKDTITYAISGVKDKITWEDLAPYCKELKKQKKAYQEIGKEKTILFKQLDKSGKDLNEEIIKDELNSVMQKIGEEAALQKLTEAWENNKKKQKEINEKIILLTEKLNEIEILTVNSTKEQIETKKESAYKKSNEIAKEKGAIIAEKAALNKYLKQLKENRCPFSTKKNPINCETSFNEVIEKIEKDVKNLEKKEKKLTKDEDTLTQEIAECNHLLQQIELNEKAKEKKKYLEKQIELLKQSMPKDIEKPPAICDMDRLNKKKLELEAQIKKAQDYNKAIALHKEINKLAAYVHALNAIINAFSPKGIVCEKIMELYINSLTNAGKDFEKDSGIAIKFIYEDGLQCRFSTGDLKWRTYELLSSGEKMMALFIVVSLCNKLSGLNLFIMDNMDALDESNLKKFLKILNDNIDNYDNIFISGVDHIGTAKILENNNVNIV